MFKNTIQKKIVVLLVAVALLATIATAVAGIYAARQLFFDYLAKKASGQAVVWADAFASYYAEKGSFEGIENAFYPMGGRGQGRMHGMMRGNGVILVGLDNMILFDSTNNLTGQFIASDQTKSGTPVYAKSQIIGFVLVPSSNMQALNTLESAFINAFTLYSLLIGIIAALVALTLGIIMARPISHPIAEISEAIHRLAIGDLFVRVSVQGEGEIRQLAEDFNAMAESLHRNENIRRNLTADVAHELRTPLAILRANLESLQSGIAKPDSSTIASLQDEVIRISRLVKDMEILSLAETGNLVINRQVVPFTEVMERLAPVMMEIEARELKIDILLDENLPPVNTDIDRTVQVMLNLLSNAIAHSPAGGSITVKGEKTGSMLQISVADQGPGIKPEQLPYVFERFYRADGARSRSEGGMGLGLAIAKSYVLAQGGNIWVDSSPGSGSVFSFTLPAA